MSPPAERVASGGSGAGFLIAAVAYLAVVFVVSHIPGQHLSFAFDIWDKAVHFAEFVPLGFLLAGWVARTSWAPKPGIPLALAVAVVVAVLGTADEFHQWFVPNRSATIGDAVADGLGGLVGAALGALLVDPRRRRSAASR